MDRQLRRTPFVIILPVIAAFLIFLATYGDLDEPVNRERVQRYSTASMKVLEILFKMEGFTTFQAAPFGLLQGALATYVHIRKYTGRSFLFYMHLCGALSVLYVINAYLLSDALAWSSLAMLGFLAAAGPNEFEHRLLRHLPSTLSPYLLASIAFVQSIHNGLQALVGLVVGYVWWRWVVPIRGHKPLTRVRRMLREVWEYISG